MYVLLLGPLAGPVVAAACIVEEGVSINGINDSKTTSESSRESTFEELISNPGVIYEVVRIEHDEIDEINILQATMKAMRLAAEGALRKKASAMNVEHVKDQCACLVDGNRVPQEMPAHTTSIIKVCTNF